MYQGRHKKAMIERQEACLSQARPEFGKAAAKIGKEITAKPIIFAHINCGNTGRKICNKHDIKQLPALKLFKEGEFVKNYAGPATELAFSNFARKELNPGPKRLVTQEEVKMFTRFFAGSLLATWWIGERGTGLAFVREGSDIPSLK